MAANIDVLAAPASCHVVRVGVSGETLMSGIRREVGLTPTDKPMSL